MANDNEFDSLDGDETTPSTEEQPVVVSKGLGMNYDWQSAPDYQKAPPRVSMDGKTVAIKSADIILPPMDKPWGKSRDGKTDMKSCMFKVSFDFEGQVEFYSGVNVFKKMENGKEMYSHPAIPRDRVNQASQVLGAYADYKKKNIQEVTIKEFMAFLNSKPSVKIKSVEVMNPMTKEKIKKNMISSFI